MKIYEVVYSGPHRIEGSDIAFLVRAPDFLAAVSEVTCNGGVEIKGRVARSVYEIGLELTLSTKAAPQILRGPYYTRAYNYGWKRWDRKIVGSDYVDDWGEVK